MPDSVLYIEVEPRQIIDVNRIFEGYEYLALVTTVDPKKGVLKLRGTPDTMLDVEQVVLHLPFKAKILKDFRE